MTTMTAWETTTEDAAPVRTLLAHRDRLRSLADDAGAAEGQYLMYQESSGSRLLPLATGTVRVGRSIGVEVTLEEPTVSRRHATLVCAAGVVVVHDDCSANGTWVNGRRIDSVELVDGDVVTFGRASLMFRDTAPLRCHRLAM